MNTEKMLAVTPGNARSCKRWVTNRGVIWQMVRIKSNRALSSIRLLGVCLLLLSVEIVGGQNQKRNRGEIFFGCFNANTPGKGNVWLTMESIGHIWDDAILTTDTLAGTITDNNSDRKWISNIRAFPQLRLMAGVTDFISLEMGSRVLSYGFEPGYYSGGVRVTWPDNSDLRLNGFGLTVNYKYIVRENAPSLGGYIGFMPEGFVVKGDNIEARLLYELDMLPVKSGLPLRLCVNSGVRFPLSQRQDRYQLLADIMVIYSGYGFDFYAGYSLESFMNFFSPVTIEQAGGKRFMVWFEENPMYLNLGGNIRYDNGITLSLTVPMLLSVNHGSRMRREDMVELIHHQPNGVFMYEKDRNIRDPFDPWFVKWKVAGAITVPIRFRMTGAEMMRNYLLLKNKNDQKVIDIDRRTIAPEDRKKDAGNDAEERLERIRRQREQMAQ